MFTFTLWLPALNAIKLFVLK